MGPSELSYFGAREMTDAEVHEIVHSFAYAPKLAIRARPDGADLHAPHGWLLQQFVSATYNH